MNVIERHTKQKIEKIAIPSDEALLKASQQKFYDRVASRLESKHIEEYRNLIQNFCETRGASLSDVAAAMALELNQDKSLKKVPQPKFTTAVGSKSFSAKRGSKKDNSRLKHGAGLDIACYRIDIGRSHGVKPGNIVGAIANESGLKGKHITGLKIHDHYSTVELPKGIGKDMLSLINNAWVCGRQMNIKRV